MTRREKCRTLSAGEPCPFSTELDGVRVCTRFHCCNHPERPSRPDYEFALAHPAGKCRHPDGDQWRDCEVEPSPVQLERPGVAVELGVLQRRVAARLTDPCPAAMNGWRCRAMGGKVVGQEYRDPKFACPLERFPAEVV